jgi:hypothetical protein
MNVRNEENLKGLFERFLGSKEAEEAVEDVRRGEQILREQRAPEPDKKLVADIKAEIAIGLPRRKARAFKAIAYKVAATAAVVIVMTSIGVKLFEKGGEPERVITASVMPTAIWESERLADDDVDLVSLTAEIEQIEKDLLAVQLGENGGNGREDVTELEMELVEIDSDFWKG